MTDIETGLIGLWLIGAIPAALRLSDEDGLERVGDGWEPCSRFSGEGFLVGLFWPVIPVAGAALIVCALPLVAWDAGWRRVRSWWASDWSRGARRVAG